MYWECEEKIDVGHCWDFQGYFTARVPDGVLWGDCNFWVCGRNRTMWPFKQKLSACTFTWCFLFFKILENEIWKSVRNLPLTTFGNERVKTSIFLTMSINVHMPPHYLFLCQTSRRSSTNYRSPPNGRHQGKLNRFIVPFVSTKTTNETKRIHCER